MHHTYNSFLVVLVTIVLVTYTNANANGDINSFDKWSGKSLPGILEDIEFAITERNLKIVNRLHIGTGIRARGYETFPDYEIILYCNLDFARKILELDPKLINACPGKIIIRQVDNGYIISAVLWPEATLNAALDQLMYNMNILVREIVDHAALEWLDADE